MSAYLIVIDTEAVRPDVLDGFADRIALVTHEHGGRYLARGGHVDVVEGKIPPQHVVVIEFDDADQARAMVASDVFEEMRQVRDTAAHVTAVIVDGLEN